MILDLQKSHTGSSEEVCALQTQFFQLSTFYYLTVCLSQPRHRQWLLVWIKVQNLCRGDQFAHGCPWVVPGCPPGDRVVRHSAEGCAGPLRRLRLSIAGISGTNPGCFSPRPLRALITDLGRQAGGPVGKPLERSCQESLHRHRRPIELSWQQSDGVTAADTPPFPARQEPTEQRHVLIKMFVTCPKAPSLALIE